MTGMNTAERAKLGPCELALFNVDALDGIALDLASALCSPQMAGLTFGYVNDVLCGTFLEETQPAPVVCVFLVGNNFASRLKTAKLPAFQYAEAYHPRNNWQHVGPLIENMEVQWRKVGENNWTAYTQPDPLDSREVHAQGPSQVMAALRAIVKSKFGKTIELPASLSKEEI